MLTLTLGGKTVTSSEDKQTITINNIPVEVERIGNAIYINKTAINVIIPEKTRGSIPVGKVLGGVIVVAGGFLAWTNSELVMSSAVTAYDFVIPYITTGVDWVMGYVNGTETAPATPAE
jgi:hypothetical protein